MGLGSSLILSIVQLIRKRVGEAQPPFAFAFEDVQTQGGPHFEAEVKVEVEDRARIGPKHPGFSISVSF